MLGIKTRTSSIQAQYVTLSQPELAFSSNKFVIDLQQYNRYSPESVFRIVYFEDVDSKLNSLFTFHLKCKQLTTGDVMTNTKLKSDFA